MKAEPRTSLRKIGLPLAAICLLAATFIAGRHSVISDNPCPGAAGDSGPNSRGNPTKPSETESFADSEIAREELMAILALEHTLPTSYRCYGYQIRWSADRYIDASRMLTDMDVAEHFPELRPRLDRLRTALEKFAAAIPEAAMTREVFASAYERETREKLIALERMTRQEIVQGDGLLGNFGKKVDRTRTSPPINIANMRLTINTASHSLLHDEFKGAEKARAEARAKRKALTDTLPELQAALREWPPEFSMKFEAYLQNWIRDWFSDE